MKLVNISNLDWVPGRLKRNQAIFTHLLDGGHGYEGGIYINPPRLAGDGVEKYLHPWAYGVKETQTAGGKPIHLVDSTYTLWDWHASRVRSWRAKHMSKWLGKQLLAGMPHLLWLNTAGRIQTPLAMELRTSATNTIFDWSDDFRASGFGMRQQDLDILTQSADKVLCVNESVAASITHPGKRMFHNCTDPTAFATWDPGFTMSPWWPKPSGTVYIGFTGGIHWTRTNLPLLEEVLLRFPAYRFLFVGYTDGAQIREWLARFPNVTFVEEIPYKQLTHVVHSFDVAIVPHADNEYTRGNDLLKVLEYFACGVPVVATPCSGLERYGNALYLASTAREFGDRIEAIINGTILHDPSAGRGIAQERSWRAQVASLAQWLK